MTHFPIYEGLLNVSLGAMQRDYIPLLMTGANDLEVTRGVLMTAPVSLEEEYAWYDGLAARKRAGTDVVYAILLHMYDEAGVRIGYRYIGNTGLHRIRQKDGTATSGTLIVDKSCFGKGYGKEAKLLLLRAAFHDLGLRKVNSSIKAFNSRSYGHLLACGFTQVGLRREQHFYDGSWCDEILFDVFQKDFEPIWKRYCEMKKLPRLTKKQRRKVSESDKWAV